MSKLAGPSSRIPTFGSRLPQAQTKQNHPSIKSTVKKITKQDIGKKVLSIDKTGILLYVGCVQFAKGEWCGIQLDKPLGKHDGAVNGIRYFSCPKLCGLMTPSCKVTLLDTENGDKIQSNVTFRFTNQPDIINDIRLNDAFNATTTLITDNNITSQINQHTIILENNLDQNDTFLVPSAVCNNTIVKSNDEQNRTFMRCIAGSSDDIRIEEVPKKKNRNSILTQSARDPDENPLSTPVSFVHFKFDKENLIVSQSSPVVNRLARSSIDSLHDQLSNHTDDSLGILTAEQMHDGFTILDESDKLVLKEKFDDVETTYGKSILGTETIVNHAFGAEFDETSVGQELKSDKSVLNEAILAEGFCINDIPLNSHVYNQESSIRSDLPSPNLPSEFSFGILDDKFFQNFTLKSETTINMELPLDTVDKSKNFILTRVDQTPSPEDLPLDPPPISEIDQKSTKSKTNSFITSITSITSLDTGYQGDGEMSRPASRGADKSPLARRCIQRPQPRRPDPMTDSDFYTESDADNHDDSHNVRGDRRAQVIDGTLYGVDPQAAADIYVNNRENMDSSGIFTDIESRLEEIPLVQNEDVSPSDTSTKTISGNSQGNLEQLTKKLEQNPNLCYLQNLQKENLKKRNASTPASLLNSRCNSREDSNSNSGGKKYKTASREGAIGGVVSPQIEKMVAKKPAGRWDAVMNKISKGDAVPKNKLKDVKSKVFNSLTSVSVSPNVAARKTGGVRQIGGHQKSPILKQSRDRIRATTNAASPKNNNVGSEHSSLSDLSGATSPAKKIIGNLKKKDVVQVTRVLTVSKLNNKSPQINQIDVKKSASSPSPLSDANNVKRSLFSAKDKKQTINKECGRGPVKNNRTVVPAARTVQTKPPSKPLPRAAEALAVLVHHLVFNVEAYEVPFLRKQLSKYETKVEEIRLACRQLEESLENERHKHSTEIEEERYIHRKEVGDLNNDYQIQLEQAHAEKIELEERLSNENLLLKQQFKQQQDEKLARLKAEFERLQKTHEESLDILREENEAIREEIDDKNLQIRDAKHESSKLQEDYETKEFHYKEQIHNLTKENQRNKLELATIHARYKEEFAKIQEENTRLLEENKRLLGYGEGKGISVQEVESLRVVLELKQNEVADLRKSLAESSQRADLLSASEEKATLLQARCEDLQHQLQRKADYELMLLSENKKLEESFKEESNHKRRLTQHNEELQWKLNQNKEVISKILEQTDVFNKSCFSEGHNTSASSCGPMLERTLSFRDRLYCNKNSSLDSPYHSNRLTKKSVDLDSDVSPPMSPTIKGVIEKSDSVSYVLDLNESPDVVASRIVRRSFRNSTPPKNTPTKKPVSANNSCNNKRPRVKNTPLSLSSSAVSITSTPKETKYPRTRSMSVRGDLNTEQDFLLCASHSPIDSSYENVKLDERCERFNDSEHSEDYFESDLTLPALPSELGRKKGEVQALPSPKHLAGEAMLSESNSDDDESTSSSSGQL